MQPYHDYATYSLHGIYNFRDAILEKVSSSPHTACICKLCGELACGPQVLVLPRGAAAALQKDSAAATGIQLQGQGICI